MTTDDVARPRVALVLAHPDDLPEAWQLRGRTLVLVALSPSELAELFGHGVPSAGARFDGDLMTMVAQGHTQSAIARRLGCSLRTVQRRLARIRQELGVPTTQELPAELVRRGLVT